MADRVDLPDSVKDINRRFDYHPPATTSTMAAHAQVRDQLKRVALRLDAELPSGREKSIVITKLEEAMFWANAAIARAAVDQEWILPCGHQWQSPDGHLRPCPVCGEQP